MSCREEGAGFEAGDALEFCFLETDNGGGWGRKSKPDSIAFLRVIEATDIP